MTQRSRFSLRAAPRRAVCLLAAAIPFAAPVAFSGTVRAADLFQLSTDETGALFDRAKPAVVQVRGTGDGGVINAGSGFFIDDQGTVLTSSTLLGDQPNARVVINGVEMDAKVIGDDPHSGLAMLRVNYNASPSLPLAHASGLQSGDGVMAIGYPLNLPVAASQGPVSGFDASYLSRLQGKASVAAVERFATTHIHANLAISPGEIGAPLLNAQGEVVGLVATSPDDGRSIYALPVEAMVKVLADFTQFGHARQGWVGVNVLPVADTQHDGRTVRVVDVVPGSPASSSGIQPGDIVMRIDSREIYRPSDVLDASFFSQVGATMNVVVRRDDKLYNFPFTVVERPRKIPSASPGAVVKGAKASAPIAVNPAR
jgi:serine protease Do